MAEPFVELVGEIIHNCGVLEFFTNNTIRALSTKSEYKKVVTKGFAMRIRELRKLVRTKRPPLTRDLTSLLDEILEVAKERNLIAHNPIVSDGKNSNVRGVGDPR